MAEDNTLNQMPFFDISTHELVEHLLFKTESVKDVICQNTDFYNGIVDACNSDILKQMEFSYATDSEFNKIVDKNDYKIELSIFHLNIRSLNKNHRDLCHFLQLLNLDFDALVLSLPFCFVLFSIWKYNLEFYANIFKGYTFYYTAPAETSIGGVGMFIKNSFSCTVLDDLKLPSQKKRTALRAYG